MRTILTFLNEWAQWALLVLIGWNLLKLKEAFETSLDIHRVSGVRLARLEHGRRRARRAVELARRRLTKDLRHRTERLQRGEPLADVDKAWQKEAGIPAPVNGEEAPEP